MLAWLIIGVSCFTNVYTVLGAPQLIQKFVTTLPVGGMGVIIVIQLLLIILGCLMDDLAIMMLTIPVFMPIIKSLGFDPVWFAVLFMVNMQVAWLSPPYGFSLFLVRAITSSDPTITMGDIYRGVVPFICLQLICLGLVMLFPNFVLWLPGVALGK
jgi:TRAP-type mannitol/chloroaromatic compound transport system permease large subunit